MVYNNYLIYDDGFLLELTYIRIEFMLMALYIRYFIMMMMMVINSTRNIFKLISGMFTFYLCELMNSLMVILSLVPHFTYIIKEI